MKTIPKFDTTVPLNPPRKYLVKILRDNCIVRGAPDAKVGDVCLMDSAPASAAIYAGIGEPVDDGPGDAAAWFANERGLKKQREYNGGRVQAEREKRRTIKVEVLEDNRCLVGLPLPPKRGEIVLMTAFEAKLWASCGWCRILPGQITEPHEKEALIVEHNTFYIGDLSDRKTLWTSEPPFEPPPLPAL